MGLQLAIWLMKIFWISVIVMTADGSSVRVSWETEALTDQHQEVTIPSSISLVPLASPSEAPENVRMEFPASPHQVNNPAPEPSAYSWQAPAVSPSQYVTSIFVPPAIAPASSGQIPKAATPQPAISPIASSLGSGKSPASIVISRPPLNKDCMSLACTEPLTYASRGSPCGCVWPIQVKLQLGVTIYTVFPLVSELGKEIATSLRLNNSQVRIMGANSDSQKLANSTILINLVPWEVKFDYTTALLIYKKFWSRQVSIKASLFGPYEVEYVRYPGLPPSPPTSSSTLSTMDYGPYSGPKNHGQEIKPIGVDVPHNQRRNGLSQNMIVVICLSSISTFAVLVGVLLFILSKFGAFAKEPERKPLDITSVPAKTSGTYRPVIQGIMSGTASTSISSSALTYTGLAKNLTVSDIERVTNSFDSSGVIGEGGFGIVYKGMLDGVAVAVKVLKREDQRGAQEFLAEVEMLSRLHHRNLVKLIGICTEDNLRCLVYELVPNGSLESHFHGVDKETAPLDWAARMKIALGAARGLAYLHEDSTPRVIHRDFKSSNILLERDCTPKVSDFGLARIAMDEGNKCISTHVMGTFGYLAPEYAMTGHLLVKSDVYSYGVVLLELLTGRKPVDLFLPPGQENLVTWARPLLTSKEGLQTIIDPAIKSDISLDSIVKVAAIASMCVQPEVSHRPFMGEVVQALKLVCNEFSEKKVGESEFCIQDDFPAIRDSQLSCDLAEASDVHDFVGEREIPIPLSVSDFLSVPLALGVEEHESGGYRRHSSSGPLTTGRGTGRRFWQRLRSLSRGSQSEH